LKHGVWPHIAEQITRFVVAIRNPATLRQVRDQLFDEILDKNLQQEAAKILNTTTDRLLQQLELFLGGVSPSLALFIDDTNQDLTDCCDALDIDTQIYRIKKFVVNGRPEYYSPDKSQPAATFEKVTDKEAGSTVYEVVEQLGGGEVLSSRYQIFRLSDGRVVKIQYSKFHDRHQAFWYGINPSAWQQAIDSGCTHFVFVMGDDGYVELPMAIVHKYVATAHRSESADGNVRHFHVHLSPPPDVVMKGYGNAPDMDVSQYFSTLE
jgi:hypothetical protein